MRAPKMVEPTRTLVLPISICSKGRHQHASSEVQV